MFFAQIKEDELESGHCSSFEIQSSTPLESLKLIRSDGFVRSQEHSTQDNEAPPQGTENENLTFNLELFLANAGLSPLLR